MASARYWRITGVQAPANGLALTAIALYVGAQRVDGDATLTSSHAPVSGALTAIQDADLTTGCTFADADVRSGGFRLVWDFGSAVDLTSMRLAAATQDAWPTLLLLEQFVGGVWNGPVGVMGGFSWPGQYALTEHVPLQASGTLNTVFLLHLDGAHGSKVFTDVAPTPLAQTVSATGVAISTAQAKFGGASAYFDGGGFIKFGTAGDPALTLGNKDFCFEAWFYDTGNGNRRQFMGDSTSSGPSASVFAAFINGGVLSCGVYFGGTQYAVGGIDPPLNQWYHLAFVRNGDALTVYINGAIAGTTQLPAGAVLSAGGGKFALGSAGDYFNNGGAYGTNWIGYADECRFVIGEPIYTSAFTPPSAPFGSGSVPAFVFSSRPVMSARFAVAVAARAPVDSWRIAQSRACMARDMEFGGAGTVYGTTKIKGTPNTSVKSRVSLLRDRDKMLARQTWSDPVTGAFAFKGIAASQKFTTLAEDVDGNFRPVAVNKLAPEVLP